MKARLLLSAICVFVVLNAVSPTVCADTPDVIFGRIEGTVTTNPGTCIADVLLIHCNLEENQAEDPAWVLENTDPDIYSMEWDITPVGQGGNGDYIDMWVMIEINDQCTAQNPQNVVFDIEFEVYDQADDLWVEQYLLHNEHWPDYTEFDGTQSETFYLQADTICTTY